MKKEYLELLKSGMLFEFYPQLTGDWNRDSEQWEKIYKELSDLRHSF